MLNDFIKLNDGINLIYGTGATGKTTIALIKVAEYCKKGKVVFIDTENGFSLERFKDLAGKNYKELLDNLFLFKINSFKDQQIKIKSIDKMFKKIPSLIVIDTLGYYYRRFVKSKPDLANTILNSQLRILQGLAEKTYVLITNQVYTDIIRNKIRPVGGNIIWKYSKCLIRLEKNPRKIILEKPDYKESKFEIINDGIVLN